MLKSIRRFAVGRVEVHQRVGQTQGRGASAPESSCRQRKVLLSTAPVIRKGSSCYRSVVNYVAAFAVEADADFVGLKVARLLTLLIRPPDEPRP
jgi:hypothetical protein